ALRSRSVSLTSKTRTRFTQRRGWDSNPRSFRSQTFQVCALSRTRRPLQDRDYRKAEGVARYGRGVFASILLAFRPAARPTGWAVLAALGAGILTQSILVPMAVTFGLIHPSDLFASLVAACTLILVRRSERPIRDAGVVAIVIIGTQVLPVLMTLRGLAGLTSLAAAGATSAADAFLDAAAIPLVVAIIMLALRRRQSRMESSPAEEKRV